MPETTPLIKAASNLRVGAGFDVYEISFDNSSVRRPDLITATGVIVAGTVGTGAMSRAVFTGISTKERADGLVTFWSSSCSQTSRRIFRSQ